jgi:hypothetical protein
MGSRRQALVAAALTATLLGLATLGASAWIVGLRTIGSALLVAGGVAAAVARWGLVRPPIEDDALAQLATAYAELERSNPTAAAGAASKAAGAAKTSTTRNRALTCLAWAALGEGHPKRAKAALAAVQPPYAVDLYCLAAVEHACGQPELAVRALEVMRDFGSLTCDGAKLLVECHLHVHGMERAVLAALQNRRVLGSVNCEHVLAAARLAGADRAAATLASVLRRDTQLGSVNGARPR